MSPTGSPQGSLFMHCWLGGAFESVIIILLSLITFFRNLNSYFEESCNKFIESQAIILIPLASSRFINFLQCSSRDTCIFNSISEFKVFNTLIEKVKTIISNKFAQIIRLY